MAESCDLRLCNLVVATILIRLHLLQPITGRTHRECGSSCPRLSKFARLISSFNSPLICYGELPPILHHAFGFAYAPEIVDIRWPSWNFTGTEQCSSGSPMLSNPCEFPASACPPVRSRCSPMVSVILSPTDPVAPTSSGWFPLPLSFLAPLSSGRLAWLRAILKARTRQDTCPTGIR